MCMMGVFYLNGSALVDIVAANVHAPDLPEKVLDLVRKLSAGVRSARN